MIFGSRKGDIVLEEPKISVPFPSKLTEFEVAIAYRNFEFSELNMHLKIKDFWGEGLKDIPAPTKNIEELTAPNPLPLVCLGSLVSPWSNFFQAKLTYSSNRIQTKFRDILVIKSTLKTPSESSDSFEP